MALAATGALLAAFVIVAVPQMPEVQRMLDFTVRGSFITAVYAEKLAGREIGKDKLRKLLPEGKTVE